MRIIQLCGSPSWGGMEMQTVGISESLIKAGHESIIVCSPGSHIESNCQQKGLPYQSIIWGKRHLLGSVGSFSRYVKTFSPDIIHIQRSHDIAIASLSMILHGNQTPIVFTRRMESNHRKASIFHRWIYNRIDRTWCVSTFIRENLLRTSCLKPEKTFVMNNGIDVKRFDPALIDRKAMRDELGIRPEAKAIGILGRISPMKGHREFIEAAALVMKSYKGDVQFLLIGGASHGEDEFGQEVLSFAKSTIDNNHLILTGQRGDTEKVLAALDILVFPSHRESFGNVLLEGMAMGLPIVSSNSGGIRDILDEETNSIWADPGESGGFAQGIMRYLQDEQLCLDHGKAGREKVMHQFRYEQFLQRLLDEYHQLASK